MKIFITLQKIARFLRRYKLFSLTLAAALASFILELSGQHTVAHWVLGVVSIVAVFPLAWRMWEDIRLGTYGIDILAATAIVTAVILGEFWAAIIVVAMLTGGESLEDYADHKAKTELDALLARAPQLAHVVRGRKTVDVPVKDVKSGDRIIIKPGEIVPVDAIILEGSGSFDESSLTGESVPQASQPGEQILSGSVNIDGAITARALHTAAASQYEQIIKLVQAAAASQPRFVRLADRYSIPFTALAYALGIGVWVASGDAVRFLEVIIVATPCPLILAAPIAFISGMSRASHYGIIVKTGAALEKLAGAKTIAFDKTGTLTLGQPKVDQLKTFGKFKKDEVLQLAASLEQSSNHVLAAAIIEAARVRQLKLIKAKSVTETAGGGLRATLRTQEIMVGRLSFMQNNGIELPSGLKQSTARKTATYVAINKSLAGVITFKDELRAESKTTLQQLRLLGLSRTMMVTGDHATAAAAVAKKLGITDVKAEALPADKLHIIESIKHRPVAFVGDGVNDAPVLATADVGIALGARGSTAASESADLVIMQDDLSRVALAAAIAKRTYKIAKQSVLIGIIISVGLMLIFATGRLTPVIGAALQEVVDVIVIFNALRAHIAPKTLVGLQAESDK